MPESTTSNGYEIEHPREMMDYKEFRSTLEAYGLLGSNPKERVAKLRDTDPNTLALMMTDINRRAQGSDDTLIHEKAMRVGDQVTIAPEDRYDTFIGIMDKIKTSSPDINPERVSDALALATVLLHPFKDGNGRTARLMGFILRDDFDAPDAADTYGQLAESRDEKRKNGGFTVNGYIPYLPEGDSQSNPQEVINYIDAVLTDSDTKLYTGPYGQADLEVVPEIPGAQ